MGHSKSRSKRVVHSYTGLPQEAAKIADKQSKFTPEGTRKRITKPKISKRKEIINVREEMTK